MTLFTSVACRDQSRRTFTLFGDRSPADLTPDPDTRPVELGVRFRSAQRGAVTGVRFFKTPENSGTHTGTLWSDDGRPLATGTFRDESDHGWQELTFDEPVPIDAGTSYVASYHTRTGRYLAEPGGLARGASNGPLSAAPDGAEGHTSVYSYSSRSAFPTSTWRAANYWVDVRLATDGPAPATTATVAASTAPTAPPTTATSTPAGDITAPGAGVTLRAVDGGADYFARWSNSLPTNPSFFPISVWNETLTDPAADTARYRAIGVNGYVGVWNGMNGSIASALRANGQWAFAGADRDGSPGYGREVAGHLWFDEADGRNVCGDVASWLRSLCSGDDRTSPQSIKAMADAVRAADGTRPTFGQYTKPVALGHGLDEATRRAYVDAVDVVSYDFYPISDPYESADLWEQHDAVTEVRNLTGRSKPVWVFIETSKLFGDPDGRATPTPAQIQAQIWHAIIGGARGIEYFNHNFSGDPTYTQHLLIDPAYTPVAEAVSQTNRQIAELAPVINAPFADGLMTVGSGRVNAMAKLHDGAYYLFVGSRSKDAQDVTLNLKGLGDRTATVVGENRTVGITGGALTDHLSGETAVHIYKIG